MSFFKKISLVFILCASFICHAEISQAPGDYSLRMKIGPSFALQDTEDQLRVGGEFDYELGYNMGVNFLALFGIADELKFQMIPSVRYDYLFVGPASFHALLGVGYGKTETEGSLDVRLGTGIILPLGDHYELTSDLNLFSSVAGTSGTPTSFEWLMGFGFKF